MPGLWRRWVEKLRGHTGFHLACVMKKVRVMRIHSFRLLRGIQADVFPPKHLEESDHQ